MTRIKEVLWIIWATCRRPPNHRVAWTMVGAWAVALFLPALSIALSPSGRGLDLSIWVGWSNIICACLDAVMLYTSIRGLMWSYNFPRESKTSPGRGSTRE